MDTTIHYLAGSGTIVWEQSAEPAIGQIGHERSVPAMDDHPDYIIPMITAYEALERLFQFKTNEGSYHVGIRMLKQLRYHGSLSVLVKTGDADLKLEITRTTPFPYPDPYEDRP